MRTGAETQRQSDKYTALLLPLSPAALALTSLPSPPARSSSPRDAADGGAFCTQQVPGRTAAVKFIPIGERGANEPRVLQRPLCPQENNVSAPSAASSWWHVPDTRGPPFHVAPCTHILEHAAGEAPLLSPSQHHRTPHAPPSKALHSVTHPNPRIYLRPDVWEGEQ